MKKSKWFLVLLAPLIMLTACDVGNQETKTTSSIAESTVATKEVAEESSDKEAFSTLENNNPTQERIDYLLDKAMHYYWHGGDLKENEREVFAGLTLKGDQEVREELLKQVIKLDPINTDYQRSLAGTKVINNKMDEAVPIFKSVTEQEPDNYEAHVQYYVYSGLLEDSFNPEIMSKMEELNQTKTEKFKDGFALIEEVRSQPVPTDIKEYEEDHLFILLGYALDDEGQMQETLINRLEHALKLLEKNPTSKIIVTGGVPKKNNTEAKLMAEWLIQQGIEENRIIQEDLATDTVENALFSMELAKELDFSNQLTVISSASHVRRGKVLFEIADRIVNGDLTGEDGAKYEIDIIGEPDNEELIHTSNEQERMVLYRDLLRIEGIWQYPNLQR